MIGHATSIEESMDHAHQLDESRKQDDDADVVVENKEDEPTPTHVNVFEGTVVEGKRKRKSLETFRPEDFKDESQKNTFANLVIKQGRGISFVQIPDICSKIEKTSPNDPIMEAAHKFLFGGIGGAKGAVVKKLIKSQLLEFSGYVPLDSIKDLEQKLTEDMTAKAYRMTVPMLKSVCDFFCVDRSGLKDKEQLVDHMLEFLCAPSIQGMKKGSKLTTNRKRSVENDPSSQQRKVNKVKEMDEDKEETENEDSGYESVLKEPHDSHKGIPTDAMLQSWVKAYCACFNLDKVTTKHAMETVSDKFGMDLSSMKDKIRGYLEKEIKAMNA